MSQPCDKFNIHTVCSAISSCCTAAILNISLRGDISTASGRCPLTWNRNYLSMSTFKTIPQKNDPFAAKCLLADATTDRRRKKWSLLGTVPLGRLQQTDYGKVIPMRHGASWQMLQKPGDGKVIHLWHIASWQILQVRQWKRDPYATQCLSKDVLEQKQNFAMP